MRTATEHLHVPKIEKFTSGHTQDKNRLAVNTQLNSFNLGYHTISKYTNVNYICVHEGELRHDFRNRKDTIEYLTQIPRKIGWVSLTNFLEELKHNPKKIHIRLRNKYFYNSLYELKKVNF